MHGGSIRPSSPISPESSQAVYGAIHGASLDLMTIRAYGNERDLVNAYYIFIHPYLPFLPPPAVPQYEDRPVGVLSPYTQPDRSILPYWPTSPLGLALSAVLVLVPMPGDPHAMFEEAIALRRSYSELYVRTADETLEHGTDHQEPILTPNLFSRDISHRSWSSFHPNVPAYLEPLLALLILSVYEYCQHGNRPRMRSRAYQALTTAMDLSLHAVDSRATENSDAQRRAWWITMFLVYQSSIFNHSAPIMLVDDPRIKTPYPEFRGFREPWPILVKAQDALVKAGSIAKGLAKKDHHVYEPEIMADNIRQLDSQISALITELNASRCLSSQEGAEALAARNLWVMARFLIYTSHIKLHRFMAFRDCPIFWDKHCDLKSIKLAEFASYPLNSSTNWALDVDSTFPFTEQESQNICLKSALALSRAFRNLPSPNPYYSDGVPAPGMSADLNGKPAARALQYPRSLPYLACCGMQSCYVLIMILLRVRASLCSGSLSTCYHLLGRPEPGSEIEDAERLIEELRNGVKSLCTSLKSNSVFEGIVDMAREVEIIYSTSFPD